LGFLLAVPPFPMCSNKLSTRKRGLGKKRVRKGWGEGVRNPQVAAMYGSN